MVKVDLARGQVSRLLWSFSKGLLKSGTFAKKRRAACTLGNPPPPKTNIPLALGCRPGLDLDIPPLSRRRAQQCVQQTNCMGRGTGGRENGGGRRTGENREVWGSRGSGDVGWHLGWVVDVGMRWLEEMSLW